MEVKPEARIAAAELYKIVSKDDIETENDKTPLILAGLADEQEVVQAFAVFQETIEKLVVAKVIKAVNASGWNPEVELKIMQEFRVGVPTEPIRDLG